MRRRQLRCREVQRARHRRQREQRRRRRPLPRRRAQRRVPAGRRVRCVPGVLDRQPLRRRRSVPDRRRRGCGVRRHHLDDRSLHRRTSRRRMPRPSASTSWPGTSSSRPSRLNANVTCWNEFNLGDQDQFGPSSTTSCSDRPSLSRACVRRTRRRSGFLMVGSERHTTDSDWMLVRRRQLSRRGRTCDGRTSSRSLPSRSAKARARRRKGDADVAGYRVRHE